ncbi:MAG: twin-arginine translocase TatA/TatE family subunit [Nannocystaceae bacterium]
MFFAFSLGVPEVAIILAIAILVFGPTKLPQLGASVGKMLRGFKKEMKALEDEKKAEADSAAVAAREEIDVTPQDGKTPT